MLCHSLQQRQTGSQSLLTGEWGGGYALPQPTKMTDCKSIVIVGCGKAYNNDRLAVSLC